MVVFLKVLWITIASIAIGFIAFWILLFFTWGMLISVDNIFHISITVGVFTFFSSFVAVMSKKEDIVKVIVSIIALVVVFFVIYLYIESKNRTLYKYINYPCKGSILVSDYNLTAVEYTSNQIDGFNLISNYMLQDKYYYNSNIHGLDKNYNVGSKWKLLGVYHTDKDNLNYLLLKNLDDNMKAWLNIDNFNYRKCKMDFSEYKDRESNIYYFDKKSKKVKADKI